MGLDMYLTNKSGKTLAYWRKANAVRRFLQEKTESTDEELLEGVEVQRHLLQALLCICKNIKENPAFAPMLLPTQNGFFFGSTEYDKSYERTIDETINMLSKTLSENDDKTFVYADSW